MLVHCLKTSLVETILFPGRVIIIVYAVAAAFYMQFYYWLLLNSIFKSLQ